jgi:hypothetical protein
MRFDNTAAKIAATSPSKTRERPTAEEDTMNNFTAENVNVSHYDQKTT